MDALRGLASVAGKPRKAGFADSFASPIGAIESLYCIPEWQARH